MQNNVPYVYSSEKVYKIQRTMKEKCLEYSALLAILTQIKKANKYKQYNCIKYWRSGQLNFVQVTEVFPTVSK